MRAFIGVISTIIILTGATLIVLALWDIKPIEWSVIWRSGVSIGIVCGTLLVLWVVGILFFKKDPFNRNKDKNDTH